MTQQLRTDGKWDVQVLSWYSRQVESLSEFGSRHKEGIEHGHSLRQHGDLQFMLVLEGREGKKRTVRGDKRERKKKKKRKHRTLKWSRNCRRVISSPLDCCPVTSNRSHNDHSIS